MKSRLRFFGIVLLLPFSLFPSRPSIADEVSGRSQEALASYFKNETRQLSDGCLAGVTSLDDWQMRRAELKQQLFEMLSLSPLPAKTDLRPVVTGTVDADAFTVEKLHFQSMPGLYVTANLYLPKGIGKPMPAVLYLCGHAFVITNGVSYGNKTAYQHHGAWFARNGYVCLVMDTVQLGEIQGIHHGTYREGMWWWNARGYSSAGVEAWNCIRALDYLQSRPEVDATQLGVTGRSGGGAYSWWVAALDERIKVAAPVAGITDLQNHIVDGTVEGHCDCMFMVNTYRWDYPLVAALVAPRPLLICNSDKDSIFPLDGVVRTHSKVAQIYKLYDASKNLGLLITEGLHQDTQDLQLPVFRWFNRHLKGSDPRIEMAATRFFTPAQLKVFDILPSDERTGSIQETFVPAAPSPVPPKNAEEWAAQRDAWKAALRERSFRGWPKTVPPLDVHSIVRDGRSLLLDVFQFTSDHDVSLRLYVVHALSRPCSSIHLTVCDETTWARWVRRNNGSFPDGLRAETTSLPVDSTLRDPSVDRASDGVARVFFAPRGLGLDAWPGEAGKQVQIRRRFMLLGQTLDGMRVWDIRRAIQALRSLTEFRSLPLSVESQGAMGVNAVYAGLFESGLDRFELFNLPPSHRVGPDYLNVLRFFDIPQALAMVAESTPLVLHQTNGAPWAYPSAVISQLALPPSQFQIKVSE